VKVSGVVWRYDSNGKLLTILKTNDTLPENVQLHFVRDAYIKVVILPNTERELQSTGSRNLGDFKAIAPFNRGLSIITANRDISYRLRGKVSFKWILKNDPFPYDLPADIQVIRVPQGARVVIRTNDGKDVELKGPGDVDVTQYVKSAP